jgi:hypothetical protein
MLPPQLLTQRDLRYFVTSHGARAYDREMNTGVYEDLIPTAHANGAPFYPICPGGGYSHVSKG